MGNTVGVVGGGQLARMMIPAALNLGLDIYVLAESVDASARLGATAVGDYRDIDTVRAFANTVDVVTFDHEHVPSAVLDELIADGVVVRPAPHALAFAQDKIAMRTRLAELGVPMPGWSTATTAADIDSFLAEYDGHAVVKTARGGYDGKGVRMIRSTAEAADWLDALADGEALLLEERVSFTRELAQLIARRPSGEVALWPVVETVQRDGVCAEVIAPAPLSNGAISDMAAHIATTIAGGLDVTGVLAVELFETVDERILVNELAMRPHNSGHWTIDGSTTSQFEQHVRAVLDLPLGATEMTADFAVMVNILGGPSAGMTSRLAAAMAAHPNAKIHSYGKEFRAGRKVGHVTVAGDDLNAVVAQARGAAENFTD